MIEQSIEAIVEACNGVIINKGNKETVNKISTDTRTIEAGSMFIPLIGENFDGHMFIEDAIKNGSSAVLIQEGKLENISIPKDITIIQVKDTLEALMNIGRYYRNLFNIPFIGVTGSVGKTTTKDLISGVLSGKYSVHKNIGNFNNQIGLPMTLLNLENHHQISVLEMGMSSYGEILDLVNIVNPQIGVITNIGVSHIEHFGSKENIMKAKMEIATNLVKGNYLLVNGDDEHLKNIDKTNKDYEVIFYGLSSSNDFYPIKIEDLGESGSNFTVNIEGKPITFKIKQLGLHNVYNGLAAVWIGLKYDMTVEEIQRGLDHFEPSKMRLEVIEKDNMKIINDAYNASPDSMKAALDVLQTMKANRKIAVLGNMFEMGSFAEEGHRSVGEYLARKKIDILITVGDMADWIGLEAKEHGLDERKIFSVPNNTEAINILEKHINENDAILVKGSRGMTMEEIVRFLQERR
ncbi:UDP-N-acetylmuramoyl-tripeptide--D-alanyl-D-alanine ligase [Alkaliphilus sp. B6464]|uniref:UDP-N-acetylmuramoyl-tripeptide--D-alanyl-D- alanine ligase n=1 Tax=Alkaliphilus sp. B6464 TaxID=2731219 RepID=UPI001BA896DA|nr:UDP-N-acetylmuramoyl-tripeptide--D-alanyl-D-alanine ligase [Alkaliphilus sp. B6464]QUH20953.1 UDP-N-acetylmuramoyl-tripeptide--D-alanyl-D-alanine ligase [Alkaliphilus sp. B6464]